MKCQNRVIPGRPKVHAAQMDHQGNQWHHILETTHLQLHFNFLRDIAHGAHTCQVRLAMLGFQHS